MSVGPSDKMRAIAGAAKVGVLDPKAVGIYFRDDGVVVQFPVFKKRHHPYLWGGVHFYVCRARQAWVDAFDV